jgi:hypothetical protein
MCYKVTRWVWYLFIVAMHKHLPHLFDTSRYYHDGRRQDLIHLNKLGLTKIHIYLKDHNCLTWLSLDLELLYNIWEGGSVFKNN